MTSLLSNFYGLGFCFHYVTIFRDNLRIYFEDEPKSENGFTFDTGAVFHVFYECRGGGGRFTLQYTAK